MSTGTSAQTEESLREKSKNIALAASRNRTLKTQRLLKFIWLTASLLVVFFMGSSMVVGIWSSYRGPFSIIGFLAAAISTGGAAYSIFSKQSSIAEDDNKLLHLYAEQAQLAAKIAMNQEESLRIYRINVRSMMERYRTQAAHNRRIGSTLQWFIIIGSVVAASSTSASATALASANWFKWVAAAMSLIVAIASAAAGFFKFRERGVAKQQTADSIARESQAVELGIRDYRDKQEKERLTIFAGRIEEIIEEQRKRELQLEESSGERTVSNA